MKEIPLTKGLFALVDDDLHLQLSKFKWCAGGAPGKEYALSGLVGRMHRFILNAPAGLDVDHINGDRLDNRKENLRICTRAENSRNRGVGKTTLPESAHQIKGAHYHRGTGKFSSEIWLDGKKVYLGNFSSAEEAGIVYNRAAKKLHGDFAMLNPILDDGRHIPGDLFTNGRRKQSSRFRGVFAREKDRFSASIWVEEKLRHLGYFRDEEEAARAYDAAALKYRGPKAKLNFPLETKTK